MNLVLVQDVEGLLVTVELVHMYQAGVRLQGVPPAALLRLAPDLYQVVGQLIDGESQDVSQAKQLTH